MTLLLFNNFFLPNDDEVNISISKRKRNNLVENFILHFFFFIFGT